MLFNNTPKTERAPVAITTSTPEVPGMPAAIDSLQSAFLKKPSMLQMMATTVLSDAAMLTGMGPLINAIVNANYLATRVAENIMITPEAPLALVSALPYVQELRLNRALADISSTPEGKELVDQVQSSEARVTLDTALTSNGGGRHNSQRMIDENGLYQRPGPIEVSAYNTHGTLTAILIHEMQHRRQLLGGVNTPIYEKLPSPIENLWHDRFIEADAEATAIDLAYKMKEAGRPAAWKALTDPFNRNKILPGGPVAYEAAVKANPNAVNDGMAKRAAFDTWFDPERDGRVKNTLSQVYNRQGLSQWMAPFQLEKLAQSGRPFEPLTNDDLKQVGALSKVNYLDLPGARPLNDPFYRAADWSHPQGIQLAHMQRHYEEIKARMTADPAITVKPPLPLQERVKLESSFAAPKRPGIPGGKTQGSNAAAMPVVPKRPAVSGPKM